MSMVKILANCVIIILCCWATFVSISALFGVYFYFPLISKVGDGVPIHRLQIIRISVFLSFAYFGCMHLLRGNEPLYPVQFLSVFLKFLTLVAIPFLLSPEIANTEYIVWLFFALCTLVLHFATKPTYRKYFSKK